MPSHANGYVRSNSVSTPEGMLGRHTPWKPSHPAMKSQLDSVMDEPFALQAIPDACFDQQIHGALLEHARPDALFDVFPGASFNNDGFDPLQVEEMRKQQSRGTGSDDSNLCAQGFASPQLLVAQRPARV